ncbi:MAG: TetR/AcrR family transcriptional regulator [Alphaproteobacteria bacterium]|nr:MAG: TetR/AcrR family transcriptional regulator [Alphaproteobacteria bacterium]
MGSVAIRKRAISPEQKALRRRQILLAAAHMFATMPYDAVNLADIAAHVGITKPALYRYFRGKETLFLALFQEELSALADDFRRAPKPAAVGAMSAALFAGRPLYCHLSAILHTVLERDLTFDEAKDFKLGMLATVQDTIMVMGDWLGPGHGLDLELLALQFQQALIGVWHTTHPTGAMREVMETLPELKSHCRDFEETLAAHLTALIGR